MNTGEQAQTCPSAHAGSLCQETLKTAFTPTGLNQPTNSSCELGERSRRGSRAGPEELQALRAPSFKGCSPGQARLGGQGLQPCPSLRQAPTCRNRPNLTPEPQPKPARARVSEFEAAKDVPTHHQQDQVPNLKQDPALLSAALGPPTRWKRP